MKRDSIGQIKFEVMTAIARVLNEVADGATAKDAKAAVAKACVEVILDDVNRLNAKTE